MTTERRVGLDGKEHVYTVLSEKEIAAKKAEMQKLQEERKELER